MTPSSAEAEVEDDDVDVSEPLPSLSNVMKARIRTLKHIPKKACQLWAKALVQALALVNETQSVTAWTQLLMLPKCTLLAPPRGGKKHKNNRPPSPSTVCLAGWQGKGQACGKMRFKNKENMLLKKRLLKANAAGQKAFAAKGLTGKHAQACSAAGSFQRPVPQPKT